jgi:hypothetical protein
MSDSDSDDERKKPQLIDDNKGLHPLFWDALPEDAEDDPLYAALKAVDDEVPPEEKAESFKVRAAGTSLACISAAGSARQHPAAASRCAAVYKTHPFRRTMYSGYARAANPAHARLTQGSRNVADRKS